MTGLLPQPVPRSVSALTALRIHHDFARQPAGSGIEPQCAVLQAKSFVYGVEHRTQSEMDGSGFRRKLPRALSISR